MAMVKILDMKEQTTNMIKLKFIRNKAVLEITNKTLEIVTFGRTKMMGIVDLRSLGFYKIKQEVLQEHLSRHYHFEFADDVCDQYNSFVNLMRTRIKRLLELLSPYSFNRYYIKGKDMVLSDFLSRQKTDVSNPHKLIAISFTLRNQIDNYFYRINSRTDQPKTDEYLVRPDNKQNPVASKYWKYMA